jgi:hypothetical protein
VLLVLALALWLGLLPGVLRHWVVPTVGAPLMLAVSTESLSVLLAEIAPAEHVRWLLVVALGPLLAGLVFYTAAIVRFDVRQLVTGRGDHWITGGWATVFPVGMYAAASFSAGLALGASAVTDFARIWVWVSLTVWLLVFTAMLGRATNRRQGR